MARNLLVALLLLFIANISFAQNNKYKINDQLYLLFLKADSARYTKEGLRLADQLYKKAVKMGDKKAQCLAYTVPVHYANDVEPKNLKSAVDKLMAISRKNGYLQYYYFGWVMYINKLASNGDTYDALQETFKLRDQSQKDNHAYGISTGYRMLGNLNWLRGNYNKALDYYEQGLEYYKKYNPEQDPMTFYVMIARYYMNSGDYQKAVANCDESIRQAKSDRSLMDILLLKGLVYAHWGKKKEFIDVYDEVESLKKNMDVGDKLEYWQLKVFMSVFNKDYSQAHKWARTITTKPDSIEAEQIVYEAEGNLKAALDCQKKRYNIFVDQVSQVQSSDLAKVSTLFGNERLKAKAREEQEALKHQFSFTLSLIGLAILIAIIIGLVYSRRKAREFIKQLTHKNEELDIARKKAEESEKMKTMFVQNVTHEIRTPLNAILGFTDLLLNPEMEISNEEKTEFRQIVHHNSNLLTGLINDVLTLSELQSGKARVNISDVKCNDLCRMAMTTVEHRKPTGVELLFTTDVADDMTIKTDERRLTQVVVNFLTNAEKYTTEGTITLDCSKSKFPGYVTFTVSDTGCGIPEEKQKLIFGRFEKLDDFHQGLGLGLNICALIANMLKASIGVDPDYHDGARFFFSLPVEQK